MTSVAIYYFEDNFILYVFGDISAINLSSYLDSHGFLYKVETLFGDFEVKQI